MNGLLTVHHAAKAESETAGEETHVKLRHAWYIITRRQKRPRAAVHLLP